MYVLIFISNKQKIDYSNSGVALEHLKDLSKWSFF